jgi:hypothetical protein
VVDEVVFMPAFAGYLAGFIENDAADGGVGRGDADSSAGQLEGPLHPDFVLVFQYIASGAKAQVLFAAFAARLKSCPDTKQFLSAVFTACTLQSSS